MNFTPTQAAYIILLNLANGHVRAIPYHQNFWLNCGLTFSRSGTRLLAFGDDQGVDWFSSIKPVWSTPFDDVIQTQAARNTASNIVDTTIYRAVFSPSDEKVAYIGRAEDKPRFESSTQLVALMPGLAPKGPEIKSTVLDARVPYPYSVAWNSDGKKIVVGYENGLKIWSDTGKLLTTVDKVKLGVFPRTINASRIMVHHAQFLNDSEILVCWRTPGIKNVRAEVGMSIVNLGKGPTRDLHHRYSWNLPMPAAAVAPNGQWAAFTPFRKKQYAVNLYTYALGYVNRETNGEQLPGFSQSGAVPPIVLKEAK